MFVTPVGQQGLHLHLWQAVYTVESYNEMDVSGYSCSDLTAPLHSTSGTTRAGMCKAFLATLLQTASSS